MLIEIGLENFSPIQVSTIRVIVAFLCLLPFGWSKLKQLSKSDLYWIFLSGFLGSLLPATLFSLAQSKIDSSISAILGGLTPVFTLIIGLIVFKQKVRWIHVLGVSLCFAGASFLAFKNMNVEGFVWWPALAVCGATICYAINVNLLKYRMKHVDSMVLSSVSMYLVGPLAAFIILQTDVLTLDYQDYEVKKSLAALVFLGATSTALGLLLFNKLLKHASPLLASSITYLIPIVAVTFGYFYGEVITIIHFVSMIFVLAGIYLVTRK